jgi:hypothetical protein
LPHSFRNASRAASSRLAIWLLAAAGVLLFAEAPLQVLAPENGLVVTSGADLTVSIKASAAGFKSVSIVGDGPFVLSTGLTAPPYEYRYPIPATYACGRYHFKAAGVTGSGATVYSDPVEVDIERGDKPKKIVSEWMSLSLAEQDNQALTVWGIYADGSKVDVTRSTQMIYVSDRPSVASVTAEGSVTGSGAGKAKITARFGDAKIQVMIPVVVAAK